MYRMQKFRRTLCQSLSLNHQIQSNALALNAHHKMNKQRKIKNMWLYPFLVGAMLGVIGSALLFLHTVGWF